MGHKPGKQLQRKAKDGNNKKNNLLHQLIQSG